MKEEAIELVVIPKSDTDKIVVLEDEYVKLIALIARKRKKSWKITAGRILRKAMKLMDIDKKFRKKLFARLRREAKKNM
jgi:hypothetical protein